MKDANLLINFPDNNGELSKIFLHDHTLYVFVSPEV